MAERKLYVAVSDPLFSPSPQAIQKAKEFFALVTPFPNANGDYDTRTSLHPMLITSMEGLESVICPLCHESTDIYDEEDWWESVQNVPPKQTPTKMIKMLCCGQKAPLLKLTFDSPCCYTKFAMGSLEPSTSEHWADEFNLKPQTLKTFEEILGAPVMQFWAYQ